MIFSPLYLEGAYRVEPEPHRDQRGYFARIFCRDEFLSTKLNAQWIQHNSSFSKKRGTLRGLHFQRPPMSEIKLVNCIKGAIWDVIVDLRANSPTFGQWYGEVLDDTSCTMLYVPQGFAHGFQSITDNAVIYYLVSERYSALHEGGLVWNDPHVSIKWPLNVTVQSQRDKDLPYLADLEPIEL